MNDYDRLGDWRARGGGWFAGLRKGADTENERHVLDVAQMAGPEGFESFRVTVRGAGDVDKRLCVL